MEISTNKEIPQETAQKPLSIQEERQQLPIYEHKEKIIQLIAENDFCIITGETGSGKTTQLPQYIFDSEEIANIIKNNIKNDQEISPLKKGKLNIAVTQPRRMATIAMSKRLCYERNMKLGQEIGYTIRFDNKCSKNTSIRYCTDGILVRECLHDPLLKKHHIVILDEAHERSLYTDVLFALVKQAVVKRKGSLKLLITSATLNTKQFSKYFNNCPVLKMKGRIYPVLVQFNQKFQSKRVIASVQAAIRIHRTEGPGHILVFLTGSEECEQSTKLCYEELQVLISQGKPIPSMMLYALYGTQNPKDQQRVFEKLPPDTRKLIFSTNIAETSLTIDGVGFVIDCGYVKQKQYNPKTGMDALVVVPISKVQAEQRKGRAGRTQDGKCFRLYTKEFYQKTMLESTIPEILRVNLANTILTLKSMKINDVLNFDYMEPPDKEYILQALKQLHLLGALTEEGIVTRLGKEMCKFPLEPAYSRSLITAEFFRCSQDMTIVQLFLFCQFCQLVSLMSTQQIWVKVPRHNEQLQEKFKKVQKNFIKLEGDHTTLISIYKK